MNRKLRGQKVAMDHAETFFNAGELREAERACEAANALIDRTDGRMDPGIAHPLGRIYMRQGRYSAALGAMAPNVQRDIPLERLDLALCYLKVGDATRARALYDPEELFARTGSFEPERTWAPDVRSPRSLEGALLWAKGIALSDVARVNEAVECYEQASRRLPKNPVLALNLAVEARNLGRRKESAEAFGIVQSLGNEKMRRLTKGVADEVRSAVQTGASASTAAGGRDRR